MTESIILHTAKLAKIPLDSQMEERISIWFTEILHYLENLESLDTHNVVPTSQVTGLTNVYREDALSSLKDFSEDIAVSNAPEIKNNMYKIKKVL